MCGGIFYFFLKPTAGACVRVEIILKAKQTSDHNDFLEASVILHHDYYLGVSSKLLRSLADFFLNLLHLLQNILEGHWSVTFKPDQSDFFFFIYYCRFSQLGTAGGFLLADVCHIHAANHGGLWFSTKLLLRSDGSKVKTSFSQRKCHFVVF